MRNRKITLLASLTGVLLLVATSVVFALVVAAPADGSTAKVAAAKYYPNWEGAKNKWVPILDVKNNGIRVGAAQIAGPAVQVDKCQAVALLGLEFRKIARMKVYVPIDSYNVVQLNRVQGVSVWATGDLKIIGY